MLPYWEQVRWYLQKINIRKKIHKKTTAPIPILKMVTGAVTFKNLFSRFSASYTFYYFPLNNSNLLSFTVKEVVGGA